MAATSVTHLKALPLQASRSDAIVPELRLRVVLNKPVVNVASAWHAAGPDAIRSSLAAVQAGDLHDPAEDTAADTEKPAAAVSEVRFLPGAFARHLSACRSLPASHKGNPRPLYHLWAAEFMHSCAVWAVDNCLKFLVQGATIPMQLLQKLACLAPSYTPVQDRHRIVGGRHAALPQCLPGLQAVVCVLATAPLLCFCGLHVSGHTPPSICLGGPHFSGPARLPLCPPV